MHSTDLLTDSDKPRSNIIPILFSAASILFLVLGFLAVFVLQSQLKTPQNTQPKAASKSGVVMVTSALTSNSTYTAGQPTNINLYVNTQNTQLSSVYLVFTIHTTAGTPSFTLATPSSLNLASKGINAVNGGYQVYLQFTPSTSGQSFSSNSPYLLGTLSMQLIQAETVTLNFDQVNSTATVWQSTQDQMNTIPVFTYTFASSNGATPTPTTTGRQCNEVCGSNADCAPNLFCSNSICRLALNPDSTTCAAPPDMGLNRACNQYCADSRECANGLTCWYNQCRLPSNISNQDCLAPSPTPTTTYVQPIYYYQSRPQPTPQACGGACNTNADCAVNLRCYYNQCRLAVNPTDPSCGPASTEIKGGVTTGGTKGGELSTTPLPSPSFNAYPVTASLVPYSSPYVTPQEQDSTQYPTLLSRVLSNLQSRLNIDINGFAPLLIIVGVILFLIALGSFITGARHKPIQSASPIPPKRPTVPPSQYEQKLAADIARLKSAPPTPPTPVSRPLTQNPPPPAAQPGMVERLKSKGVIK